MSEVTETLGVSDEVVDVSQVAATGVVDSSMRSITTVDPMGAEVPSQCPVDTESESPTAGTAQGKRKPRMIWDDTRKRLLMMQVRVWPGLIMQ